jgi:tetratricopeptide (TPR) repeat protein
VQRAIVLLLVLASAGVVYADRPDRPDRLERIRRAYESGDFQAVRAELLAAYELEPQPQLLFALGQVELNLGNYQAAIDYYEKFIATSPNQEQVALAQQAIGAARMRLATPPPDPVLTPAPPPPPPPRDERRPVPPRQWYAEDTGLVALGSAAIVVGAGLLYYSHRLGTGRSGSLADYHERVELSRTTRWTGLGVTAAGALVVGITLLRWRLRPDGTDLAASITPGSATFAITGRW